MSKYRDTSPDADYRNAVLKALRKLDATMTLIVTLVALQLFVGCAVLLR